LIAGGFRPIPPDGWGAVENIIWNYKQYLERRGHTVDIHNTFLYQEIICAIHANYYDFVHTHYDPFCLPFNKHLKQVYCATTHSGHIQSYIKGVDDPCFDISLQDMLEAPGLIVLSNAIKQLFLDKGYKNFLHVQRNGVEVNNFRFQRHGNGKAICLGKIETRKRQAELARLTADRVGVDFVGPCNTKSPPDFCENATCHYVGSWSKDEVYDRLTEYSCLVLLSESEAAPLVVLEALAAGLSVVVTESASANLTEEQFITVIPDGSKNADFVSNTIQSAIDSNNDYRQDIRSYAFDRFDYSVLVKDYELIIHEFRDYYPDPKKAVSMKRLYLPCRILL
jgi:glycosyltransferase involved in cell wall biosynthesis